MGNEKWKKVKQSLGVGCLQTPTLDGDDNENDHATVVNSSPASSTTNATVISEHTVVPVASSSPRGILRFLRSSSKSGTKRETCPLCMNIMIPGDGHAVFTTECSHSFHFTCITSEILHGNQVCPVCQTKWNEFPFESRTPGQQDGHLLQPTEPTVYDDDDAIEQTSVVREVVDSIAINAYPEVSAIPKSSSYDDFTVLIHLSAPMSVVPQNARAPTDLVTVLDVSGSMAGTKLVLLKRAMEFVIHHLGPHDRLAVIAFSSTAHRLLPLCRMTGTGKHQALQAVNSLNSNGGTDIAEALRKGTKVINERKYMNPVSNIILLSDGQDTYTINGPQGYQSLLPSLQVPVHAFRFGGDHDAGSMSSLSEGSGGTFSFIGVEGAIQEAFAQCIGGMLSVRTVELVVSVECIYSGLKLSSIQAGSYQVQLMDNERKGVVEVGNLYAEEDRDFLVTMNISPSSSINEMHLLNVNCTYRDPLTNDLIASDEAQVKIGRPRTTGRTRLVGSMEVDRQRNRLRADQAMSEAKAAAEQGDLAGAAQAISILEDCRVKILKSPSAQAGDALSVGVINELRMMQKRMCNRHA